MLNIFRLIKPMLCYLSNITSILDAYSSSYIFGDISPTILIWWRSKNANYGTPSQCPHISISNFGIFKDKINMFVITLSIDNQWTVEWHTWLPYKTNQFHMQHDFRFSSYRPHSACPGVANNFFSVQSILFNYCLKVLSMKIIWINIRTKNVHQNLCCVGSLLQYILKYTTLIYISYMQMWWALSSYGVDIQ